MLTRRRTVESSDSPKPRREGRGLGPFTSGNLTLIIVTLTIVIGFPFAAFAVTGSNIFVTDATSGAHAKVDANGNLAVGGAVFATAAAPKNLFSVWAYATVPGESCAFFTPKAGHAAVVTSVDAMSLPGSGQSGTIAIQPDSALDCGNPTATFVSVQAFGDHPSSATDDLGSGIGLANGHYLDLQVGGQVGVSAQVVVRGYYVPATQCATACL